MESTLFPHRTLASTNQNLHLKTFFSSIWKCLFLLHLPLVVSKGNTFPWKVKKGSLPVNKFLKKLKHQTTKVQKNINFEYARQAREHNMPS